MALLEKERKMRTIIKRLSAIELEEMLKASTRNSARDVIESLLDERDSGLLTQMLRWINNCTSSSGSSSLSAPQHDIDADCFDDDSYLETEIQDLLVELSNNSSNVYQ